MLSAGSDTYEVLLRIYAFQVRKTALMDRIFGSSCQMLHLQSLSHIIKHNESATFVVYSHVCFQNVTTFHGNSLVDMTLVLLLMREGGTLPQ